MALGDPPIRKPVAERPEWVPHPEDKRLEVNTKTGQWRTRIEPPKVEIDYTYGFPIVRPPRA